MNCYKCNHAIQDGVRYCPNCGVQQPSLPPEQTNHRGQSSLVQQQQPQRKNNTLLIIVISVVGTIICGLLLFILFIFKYKEPAVTSETVDSHAVYEEAEVEGVSEFPITGAQQDEHTYDWLSERAVTTADLAGRPVGELRLMRNWIFARHGYIFKSGDLRDYFGGLSWYTPKYQNIDKYLSTLERENISAIKKYESGETTAAVPAPKKTGSHRSIGFTEDYSDWVCYIRLTDDDVAGLGKQELRILRNTIYARHGRKFKSADLRNYFSGFSWYEPRYDEVSESSLSSVEKHNIALIKRYE